MTRRVEWIGQPVPGVPEPPYTDVPHSPPVPMPPEATQPMQRAPLPRPIPTTTATRATLEEEVAEEAAKLSTSEKILIASLFFNVVTFAWSVYKWRREKKPEEE